MEIKDIAGFGKAIEKLIDATREVIGDLSRPYLTKQNADAEAYRIRQIGAANADVMKQLADAIEYVKEHGVSPILEGNEIKAMTLSDIWTQKETPLLPERAKARKEFQELKKQNNVEEITRNAVEELAEIKGVDEVSDESVEPDWMARFFDIAEDISNEDMQKIWGKILAGEVKKPKSFSLRTLEVLKNLSTEEAQLFTKVAQFAIEISGGYFFALPDHLGETETITFSQWLILEEAGLVIPNQFINAKRKAEGNPPQIVYIVGEWGLIIETDVNERIIEISNVRGFTSAGNQLLTLIPKEPPNDYFDKFINLVKLPNYRYFKTRLTHRDAKHVHFDGENIEELT
jgi:hypothetical protein